MKSNKTVVITGATGTIGEAISLSMARLGYNIIFTARSEVKAQNLLFRLKTFLEKVHVSYRLIDLGDKDQIIQFSNEIDSPIDVLINNAAITPRRKALNNQHIEMQWAVNVLTYFWMMKYFAPRLQEGINPRIVNVASYWAGHLDLADPEFNNRPYDNNTAYMQSKQADRMLSKAFSSVLREKGISVNSCHPGDANSALSNSLGFGGHESPEQAADTPVWLATQDIGFTKTGCYFRDRSESLCSFSQNSDQVNKLYELCSGY